VLVQILARVFNRQLWKLVERVLRALERRRIEDKRTIRPFDFWRQSIEVVHYQVNVFLRRQLICENTREQQAERQLNLLNEETLFFAYQKPHLSC
jgi:hypothetical protein